MERYIGIDEAAKLIGVSRYILREDMKRGMLTGYKCRKRIVTTERALEEYMQRCAITPEQVRRPGKAAEKVPKYVPGMKLLPDGTFVRPEGRKRA